MADFKEKILLPGLNKQLNFLLENLELQGKKILVIGSSSEQIAKYFAEQSGIVVEYIIENYDSLMNARLILDGGNSVNVKIMDFETTDYEDDSFDLIYAQGSISLINRNKILREIKRILKTGGWLNSGEIVVFNENIPSFIRDIFDASGIDALLKSNVQEYFKQRSLLLKAEKDLSETLKEFYSVNLNKIKDAKRNLSEKELSYYKKLLNKISHESKAYLSQGADKHIGFVSYIFQKATLA